MDIFREEKQLGQRASLLVFRIWKELGKGEVSWSGVNDIIAGVQEKEIAREGVAVLLNDVWHSAVVKSGCVIFRILWTKFKFSKVKVCVIVGYGPNEGDGETT